MLIESWSRWLKRTCQATRRNNPIRGKANSTRFLPAIESLEDRCTPSIVGNASFTSTPSGANFNYTITLNNTGTTNIGTFWFAWIPGQDYMANSPISIANPTGWTSTVTGGFAGDGHAIRWVASSNAITPGNSLNFNFTSAETPTQLRGNSPFFSHPEGTSFIYIGAPETDPGFEFVVKPATTATLMDNGPNPSTSGGAVSFTAAVSGGASITGQTVFIEDADASNAVVASPTLSSGTVTFNISGLTVGTHHLFAVYSGDTTHAGSNSSLAPVIQVVNSAGPAPAVSSVVVNGGPPAYTDGNGLASPNLAGQNSVVEQILVTFNEAVTLDAGAFTITNNAALVTVNNGPTPNTAAVTASFAVVPSTGNTEFIVTFSGPGTSAIPSGTGSVIKDGLYTLNTIGSHVHANSQTAADNNTKFWALYGSVVGADNNLSSNLGDGTSEVFVDNFDYSAFKTTFGSETDIPTGIPYNVGLDGDLNGFVDNFDYSEFKGNFGADWSF